jgi:hypothetical protein
MQLPPDWQRSPAQPRGGHGAAFTVYVLAALLGEAWTYGMDTFQPAGSAEAFTHTS